MYLGVRDRVHLRHHRIEDRVRRQLRDLGQESILVDAPLVPRLTAAATTLLRLSHRRLSLDPSIASGLASGLAPIFEAPQYATRAVDLGQRLLTSGAQRVLRLDHQVQPPQLALRQVRFIPRNISLCDQPGVDLLRQCVEV